MSKRMFVGFLIVGMLSTSAFAGDYISRFAKGKNTPSRQLMRVRNVSGVTQSAKNVVIWTTATVVTEANCTLAGETGYIGVDVSTNVGEASKMFAGVLYEDIADGEYGRMYIRGYCVVKTTGAISTGDGLQVSGSTPYAMVGTTAGAVFGTFIQDGDSSPANGADEIICILGGR